MKNIFAFACLVACTLHTYASEPNGYYSSCEGKSGAALLSQLESVVGSHTNVGYDGLWTLYRTSDTYPDGTIWDMYSTKHFTYKSDQCGNYKNVGDCYNREHSMPKSWFNDALPMYSDAFHIYPTDGKVNGQRGNYPYGECAGGTTLAGNGTVKALGKLGKSTFSGYSGTVFEPDDEYKGDFARSYFYMAAAYNSKISGWDSDMLAGNSYPAFSGWAVELLLKWHRQDPVSDKETARNEAVYAAQRNRNPFIDHPELAEHIWGTKKAEGWSGSVNDPEITLPVDGSSLNLGTTMTGISRSASVVVKGVALTGTVTVTAAGAGFSASPSSFQGSSANTSTGYTVTVTYNPQTTGTHTGTLRIDCGKLSTTVNLSGSALSTIPAGPVTGISDDSFEAVWSYVGDDDGGYYTLDVEGVAGFPKKVDAKAERYVVDGLDASTTYKYTVSSKNHKSETVEVTTLAPIPSVAVLFDGNLEFNSEPGVPSEVAELLLEIDNIATDITLSVNSPFQLSDDKSQWEKSITISPDQDRVYLRMLSDAAGTFNGTLVITAGEYSNDNVVFSGTVGTAVTLFEDFEAEASGLGNYSNKDYQGTAALWHLTNAGFYPDQHDAVHSGLQAVRFGKNSKTNASAIEMKEDTKNGVGDISLWARKWIGDPEVTFVVEYSADGGSTWKDAGNAKVTAETYTNYKFTVNSVEPIRIRLRQTGGSRWLLDDIEASPYKAGLVPESVADYHRWDAFCRNGQLIIEASEAVEANVYALDGTEVFAGTVAPGTRGIDVARGLYIVAVDGFARRVLVK